MQLNSVHELEVQADEIRRIKNINAAKGKPRSGQTLVEVREATIEIVNRRRQLFVELVDEAGFDWEVNLQKNLDQMVERFFSNDLGDLQVQIDDVYKFIGNQRAAEKIQAKLIATINNVRNDLHLVLQNKLSILKNHIEKEHEKRPVETGTAEDILEIKPGIGGITLNLKELWRRFRERKT